LEQTTSLQRVTEVGKKQKIEHHTLSHFPVDNEGKQRKEKPESKRGEKGKGMQMHQLQSMCDVMAREKPKRERKCSTDSHITIERYMKKRKERKKWKLETEEGPSALTAIPRDG